MASHTPSHMPVDADPFIRPIKVRVIASRVLELGADHNPQALIDAAELVAQLVRHLNHATTLAHHPQRPVRFDLPGELAALVNQLQQAAASLPQLCQQIREQLAQLGTNPDLYAIVGGHNSPESAQEAVFGARGALVDAGEHAKQLGMSLTRAYAQVGSLGLADPADPLYDQEAEN